MITLSVSSRWEAVFVGRIIGKTGWPGQERPKSFHEIVAMFEKSPQRLEKLRLSGLRKCASEDSMFTDLVLQKIYHSESDLHSESQGSGLKLALEMKLLN